MSEKKNVLVVGLDPTLIDFTQPGYPPGLDAEKVFAGIKSSEEMLTGLGYNVQTCLTDFGDTAEAVVEYDLKQKPWDCVMIGAGVRTVPSNFLLFEKLVNVVHEHAPQAKMCFNQLPADIGESVKRWV
jgi:hypothetical protein